MSMPKFPEVDPNITYDHALNMILASIAMEELALSHIINAEGEKLQYILGTLETSSGRKPDVDEVLKVNQSIACLLEGVSQNQMILKNKMDKVLHARSEICPEHTEPPTPQRPECKEGPTGPICKCQGRCSAAFKAAEKCHLWCADSELPWKIGHLHGACVCHDPCNKTKIELCSSKRFVVSFAVNVRAKSNCKSNASISLQMINNHQCTNLYTVHAHVSEGAVVTISMGGIMIETSNHRVPSALLLKLVSPDALMVEDSMLSIMEI